MMSTAAGNLEEHPVPRQDHEQDYKPDAIRKGVALCLSGGGFRATLFHLGALRRLNELGILHQVDTITSVSGGSIMSGVLASRLPWPLTEPVAADVWDRDIAQTVYSFVMKNLRTPVLFKRWLKPWDTSGAVRSLMTAYADRLSPISLGALPERPRFVFCSTDLYFGVNFVFERERVGDYRLGYTAPPAQWQVARAIAASSCFPPVFNPLPLDLPVTRFTGGRGKLGRKPDVRLSDGGLYDNLGLEPVWKTHATVLVSDGGAVFNSATDRGLLRRLGRYVSVVDNQALALRKRWLISSFLSRTMSGTYWGIGSSTRSYEHGGPGYSPTLVRECIAPIRTDLDAFSKAEISALENHGYALADAAVATHLPHLLPKSPPAPVLPHPAWSNEAGVRSALKRSSKRAVLGHW